MLKTFGVVALFVTLGITGCSRPRYELRTIPAWWAQAEDLTKPPFEALVRVDLTDGSMCAVHSGELALTFWTRQGQVFACK